MAVAPYDVWRWACPPPAAKGCCCGDVTRAHIHTIAQSACECVCACPRETDEHQSTVACDMGTEKRPTQQPHRARKRGETAATIYRRNTQVDARWQMYVCHLSPRVYTSPHTFARRAHRHILTHSASIPLAPPRERAESESE